MNYIDTTTLEYPLTAREVRQRVNASVPSELFPPDGYAAVTPSAPPAYNTVTQTFTEAPPALVGGAWTQQWLISSLPQEQAAANLATLKTNSVLSIDREVDAIYLSALGNRGPEYTDAEQAAQAYADAGYTGTVPDAVQSWATAKGWTATQAANDILAAAGQLRAAKSAIRAARLLRKEQVRAAADGAAVATAMAQWTGFVTAIKAQLGL